MAVLPEADPDLDEAGADDEPVFAGADEDVDADAEAVADVDADVVGDVVGVADVGVAAGDEYVLAGWDVLACDAGLAGEDRGADEAVDAEPWGFADAGGVA